MEKKLTGKKKLMYEALTSQLGVVTAAAKLVGIDRTTHYKWLKEDENYKQWIEELPEIALDFAENALFKLMKTGTPSSIIFYLKTKGKERGYIERQEIESNIKVDMDMDKIREAIKSGKGLPFQ